VTPESSLFEAAVLNEFDNLLVSCQMFRSVVFLLAFKSMWSEEDQFQIGESCHAPKTCISFHEAAEYN
jgi:hypothetical protein